MNIPEVDPGGAAGACSPSPMETGTPTPKTQGRNFSPPFSVYLSPRSIFAPKALCRHLPASKDALLIRKGALFAHERVFLCKHGAPPASRRALLIRKTFSPCEGALQVETAPLQYPKRRSQDLQPLPMKIVDPSLKHPAGKLARNFEKPAQHIGVAHRAYTVHWFTVLNKLYTSFS